MSLAESYVFVALVVADVPAPAGGDEKEEREMIRKRIHVPAFILAAAIVFVYGSAPAGERTEGQDGVLTKVTFIHFKKGHERPSDAKGSGQKGTEGYYSYIAQGAKWRTVEDFRLNPSGNEDLPAALVTGAVNAGMNEWETPGDATFGIFGDVIQDPTATYNDGAYRGYNTISFGSYGDPGVIAITTVWGYFSGSPSRREIIEAHILMNDDFIWGDASVDPVLMDVQNILTHELGHCAGMGDLYKSPAREETMYGYSTEGELKKRDLYKGDIAGIINLYR